MTLFLLPNDYTITNQSEEISFIIGKKTYSMWTKKSNKDKIFLIANEIDKKLKYISSFYSHLSYDYLLIITMIEMLSSDLKIDQSQDLNNEKISQQQNNNQKELDLFSNFINNNINQNNHDNNENFSKEEVINIIKIILTEIKNDIDNKKYD